VTGEGATAAAAARWGRFVVFEGGEATGKSTQAARLAARLDAVLTHEPGATELGVSLRSLLLDAPAGDIDHRTEALLMAADRAQHVAEVVRPALAAGRHVVSDRYIGSSLAYQGFGRGLPVDDLRRLSAWATGGLWPDLIVLLEVQRKAAFARRGHDADRIESAGEEFHERVLAGFAALAAADPARWVVIDGTLPPDDVEAGVWAAITDRCPELVPGTAG
jgi:dTMP kinase